MKRKFEELPDDGYRKIKGGKIRVRRAELGINQTELAERVGVHQSTISKWEKGLHDIGGRCSVRLARALELDSIEELEPDNGKIRYIMSTSSHKLSKDKIKVDNTHGILYPDLREVKQNFFRCHPEHADLRDDPSVSVKSQVNTNSAR